MDIGTLNIVWFILIGVLLIGYAVLDGFDLGVGMLQIFNKKEEDKKIFYNSIAPFWDGNEVWLITGGGALFAAFPHVYATVFSGFYIALMLLLVALIFRAVSLEFRAQVESEAWKKFWDYSFTFGSLVATLLFGVALGNIYQGIPLDAEMNYTGGFFTLLRPIPLVIGLTGVFMFALQGASFLIMKTENELQDGLIKKAVWLWRIFVIFVILTTLTVAFIKPWNMSEFLDKIAAYPVILALFVGIIYYPIALAKKKYGHAFICSSLVIVAMFSIVGVTIYPNLVPDIANPSYSLNIVNAASSQLTLKTMLYIALIGVPIVLTYTIIVYRVFKGKVKHDEYGY